MRKRPAGGQDEIFALAGDRALINRIIRANAGPYGRRMVRGRPLGHAASVLSIAAATCRQVGVFRAQGQLRQQRDADASDQQQ
jgi:hypothetical protein